MHVTGLIAGLVTGLAAAGLLAGCQSTLFVGAEPAPDAGASPDAVAPPALGFRDVQCWPPVPLGAAIPAEDGLYCEFRVTGPRGVPATLTCRDEEGSPLPCGQGGLPLLELSPRGPQPLPIDEGWFWMDTDGLAGLEATLWWVATTDTEQATFPLHLQVVPGSGTNSPPTLDVICAGDGDGRVTVVAGDPLECDVIVDDPDPYDLLRWMAVLMGPPPVNRPSPEGGDGPGIHPWQWQTDASESGQQRVVAFSVGDHVFNPIRYDLLVEIQ